MLRVTYIRKTTRGAPVVKLMEPPTCISGSNELIRVAINCGVDSATLFELSKRAIIQVIDGFVD